MADKDAHVEAGGLRWGKTYLRAAHASWPFGVLRVDGDGIEMRVRFPIFGRRFAFSRSDIAALRFRQFAGWGLQVEHNNADYPPHISFWTADKKKLSDALASFRYELGAEER